MKCLIDKEQFKIIAAGFMNAAAIEPGPFRILLRKDSKCKNVSFEFFTNNGKQFLSIVYPPGINEE